MFLGPGTFLYGYLVAIILYSISGLISQKAGGKMGILYTGKNLIRDLFAFFIICHNVEQLLTNDFSGIFVILIGLALFILLLDLGKLKSMFQGLASKN